MWSHGPSMGTVDVTLTYGMSGVCIQRTRHSPSQHEAIVRTTFELRERTCIYGDVTAKLPSQHGMRRSYDVYC